MEHVFLGGKIVPNWAYFGQGEDFKLTTELSEKYMLFAGWEVRIVKNCDRGLENDYND